MGRVVRTGVMSLKKDKKRGIHGIESKIVLLIFAAMILAAGVFLAAMLTQNKMLSGLAEDTAVQQQSSIEETTTGVIDTVIKENMDRITTMEAQMTDEMFQALAVRVRMMGDYAQKLFDDPESFPRLKYARPDASKDGELSAQVLFAEDAKEEALADRVGLLANMSDMMFSLCTAYGADNICIALPEGVTLAVNTVSGDWVREDGSFISFDARTRYWYRQAVEAGQLTFSDIELDRATGEKCVTCSLPVYDSEGTLQAVASADLFLTEMQRAVAESPQNGAYLVVVNQNGHVILSPEEKGDFQVLNSSEAKDLRSSDNEELAALVRDALQGKTDVRRVKLKDSNDYMIGVPMHTVGWALIAIFSEAVSEQPARLLRENYQEIQQEATLAYRGKSAQTGTILALLLIVLLVLMLGGALLVGSRIVRPIKTITKRIGELNEDDPEFRMEDAYRTGDEVEALAQSFAYISHKTVDYIDQVRRVTAEKERIGTELHMANQIQESMLPNIFPAYPDRKEFDLYASMNPAKEVGGDFYDYFLIDEDHLALVIADVSGKGVPAALFMMVSKAILKNNILMGRPVGEVLSATNETICSNNAMEMFVTVWLGILTISTGRITAANAGHERPAILRSGGKFILYEDRHSFVVGGIDGVPYKEYEFTLQPGDKLFLYTDGVPEATDADERLFGTQRMIDALNSCADGSPKAILEGVRAAVDDFVGDAEQFDDLTMLCLEYR